MNVLRICCYTIKLRKIAETKKFHLEVARWLQDHVSIKYEPNRAVSFQFLNLLLGKFDLLKVTESMRNIAETKNFHLVFASRPKEHMDIKYEPNWAVRFHFLNLLLHI